MLFVVWGLTLADRASAAYLEPCLQNVWHGTPKQSIGEHQSIGPAHLAGLLISDLEVDTSRLCSLFCSVSGLSVSSLSIKYPTLSKPLIVSINGLDVRLRQHQVPQVSGQAKDGHLLGRPSWVVP